MVQKKQLFDKVMLLTRLKEEEVIVVREVKQHWEYLRSAAGMMQELTSQISEWITEPSLSFLNFSLFKCMLFFFSNLLCHCQATWMH